MSPATVRILIADDHQVVRTGFRELLDTQPDFSVVGTASDGAEAVRLSRELQADVVLMDVRMPGMDGIAATRELTRSHPGPPRVLILTTFDLDQYVYDALRAGASGFLLKDATAERLFDAVRVIAAGDALLAPAVTRRLIHEFAQRPGKAVDTRPAAALKTTDTPRDRGPETGRRRTIQLRDRLPPGRHRRNGQDPRQPDPDQTRSTGSHPSRSRRIRIRPRATRKPTVDSSHLPPTARICAAQPAVGGYGEFLHKRGTQALAQA